MLRAFRVITTRLEYICGYIQYNIHTHCLLWSGAHIWRWMSGGGVVKNEPLCLEANIGDQRGADRKIASKVYTTIRQQTNINLLGMSASRGGRGGET